MTRTSASLAVLLASVFAFAPTTSGASTDLLKNPFQGFYGQVASGYEANFFSDTTTRYTNAFPDSTFSSGMNRAGSQRSSGIPLVVGVGYYFPVSEKWVLGIGADFSFLPQTTNAFSARNPAFINAVPANGQQIKTSNRFNLFLSPGYALTPQDLFYGKIGYSNQQIQFSRPPQDSTTGYSLDSRQGGYVLGLGYRKILDDGLYFYAEVNYLKYSNQSMSGSTTTNTGDDIVVTRIEQNPASSAFTGLIGLGYRF